MDAFMKTDIGKKRANNQDYVFKTTHPIGTLPNLFILADGMGGHAGGDIASKNTVKVITEVVEKSKETEIPKILTEAVYAANEAIFEKASENEELRSMGTTLVIATIKGKNMTVVNVGDSRLYTIDGDIKQITHDHSYVEEMIRSGVLTREEAKTHSKRNSITRAIGAEKQVKPDVFEIKLENNSKVLMCSDGLYNMVDDNEINNIVNRTPDGLNAVKTLVDTANANGGKDNVSVILITL